MIPIICTKWKINQAKEETKGERKRSENEDEEEEEKYLRKIAQSINQ